MAGAAHPRAARTGHCACHLLPSLRHTPLKLGDGWLPGAQRRGKQAKKSSITMIIRGLCRIGPVHGQQPIPGRRPGGRGRRRRLGNPPGARLARRQTVAEHSHRLRPGHRDHPPAAGRPRAVLADLVPGGGDRSGHRRHRAARGPVRPAATGRPIVPGQRGPQARRRVGLVWLAGPARAYQRQPGRRHRPAPGRAAPCARARPDPGAGPRACARGRSGDRPGARPHRSAGGPAAVHWRPAPRRHRCRRR